MSPLLLAYTETPSFIDSATPDELVYCPRQNLTVLRTTNEPAIVLGSLETETFTRTFGESTDTDRNLDPASCRHLATGTETFTRQEVSDADPQGFTSIRSLLETGTRTFTQQESSDTD
jgi:hypothetical protein